MHESQGVVKPSTGPLRTLLRYGLAVAAAVLPRSARVHQTTVDGLRVVVWLNEYIGRKLALSRSFEQAEVRQFKRLVRPGDTCVDVGANIGWHSLQMARACGPDGHVFAFEPVDRNGLLVELNADLNGYSWITVDRRAVSATDGEAFSAQLPEGDSAYAYFSPEARDPGEAGVVGISLDSYCASHAVDSIDFLKVDVEGAEFRVLQGGRRVLESPEAQPRAVVVELVDEYLRRFGATSEDVFSLMAEYGYRAHSLQGGRLIPCSPSETDVENVFFLSAAEAARTQATQGTETQAP